jgi:hypoxanthine phosphoribosyltransferase
MSALVWALPLVVSMVAIAGYVKNRDRLLEIVRVLQNQKRFSAERDLPPRHAFPLVSPDNLNEMKDSDLQRAVADIIAYAREYKPDWIAGVHPGGRLLSVIVGEQLGLSPDRCIYVSTYRSRTANIDFMPPINNVFAGKLLIIDDISRTGDTLRAIRSYLYARNLGDSNYRLTSVRFAVLLVVETPDDSELRFRPDWVYGRTKNQNFKLPWSQLSADIREAYDNRQARYWYNRDAIREHRRICRDFEYALEKARRYLGGILIPKRDSELEITKQDRSESLRA